MSDDIKEAQRRLTEAQDEYHKALWTKISRDRADAEAKRLRDHPVCTFVPDADDPKKLLICLTCGDRKCSHCPHGLGRHDIAFQNSYTGNTGIDCMDCECGP